MRLNVWILEPDADTAGQLVAAWKHVAGDRVNLQIFSVLPTSLEADLPDLFMGEFAHCCEEVTELLHRLRPLSGTDFLPVTGDPSPSSFTRAQQLGAIDYILKPFTPRRLRKSLRRYLALKRGLSAGCALTQHQLDRFFFQINIDYPSAAEEEEILRRTGGMTMPEAKPLLSAEKVLMLLNSV